MTSGRLAVLAGVIFLALIALQLSSFAGPWNSNFYLLISAVSNESDGFLIRRLAAAVTGLGDTYFCLGLLCLTLFWGWTTHSMIVARGFAVAMLFVGGFNSALKLFIAVPRPESGQWMASFSFPSGHASAGVAAWTMLAMIAFMGMRHPSIKYLSTGLLILIGLAVAISRIVIGVHWPLDVITGIFEGFMVAAVFYRVVYQTPDSGSIITHDAPLLLAMTLAMSLVYSVL